MKPVKNQVKIERPQRERISREEALKRVKTLRSVRKNSLPLSEKIRVELFIPDLPDPVYGRLPEELSDELCYEFGGCSVTTAVGKYRTTVGAILPDNVRVLFSDTPFSWGNDRLLIERYAEQLRHVVQQVLSSEEAS